MKFRSKTILGVALIEVGLLALLIGSTMSVLRESNEAELASRVQLGAKMLAAAAKDAIISQDLATLNSLVLEVMASRQIAYVRLIDAGGVVLAQRGDAAVLARKFQADARVDQVADGIFDRSEQVLSGGIRYGEVQMGVSVAPLRVLLASTQRWAAGLATLEIGLVALFSWLLGTYLTRQLVQLRQGSERFASGELSYRVAVHGNDELAQTARAFNLMAQQLSDGRDSLRAESRGRLQAQQRAERAGNLLNEAVNCIAQGFTLYDEHDRLVQCNAAYLDFYPGSRDLMVAGNSFEQIVRGGAERGQYLEAVGRVDEWVAQRVAQHQQAHGEVFEQQLADGRWLLVIEQRTPSGHIVGNRIDVTEIKRATEALADRNEQLSAMFTLSPDGFVSFGRDLRVKYASPAFSRLTGLPEASVVGLDQAGFSAKLGALCTASACFRGIDSLQPSEEVEPGLKPQRTLIELSGPGNRVLQVGLRQSKAGTVSQILYLRDVTYETEVDRMKSEFLSTAAHELRTPMASIYGFAEVLLTQELDALSRKEFLAIIFRQSELMSSILNELLDLARIDARRGMDFVFRQIHVQGLMDRVVHEFKLPKGRLAPTLELPETALYVRGDESKLQQALLNLLSNAYKFSPKGGAVNLVARARAEPATGSDGGGPRSMVSISVEDQGIGLAPEQLLRVGERFYRSDDSGKIAGTGLGMSIVKEIVQLHGGTVQLSSQVGAGTEVTLWLPASQEVPLQAGVG